MPGLIAPPAPENEPMDAADVLSAVADILACSPDERIEGVEECDGTPPYAILRSRDGKRFRLTINRMTGR